MSEKKDLSGRRQRLRERFLKGGESSLADYEFIEMHLYAVNARHPMVAGSTARAGEDCLFSPSYSRTPMHMGREILRFSPR